MSLEPEDTNEKKGLSTVDGVNPLKVLEQFNSGPIILVAVAIWTRHSQTGMLEEKGIWIKNFWSRILNRITDVQGCQLLWNTLFFAIPSGDVLSLKELFREELSALYDALLESFCIIAEAHGTPAEKLILLDELQGELAKPQNFGNDNKLNHTLRDGKEC